MFDLCLSLPLGFLQGSACVQGFKLPSVATVFKLASDTGSKFRRCKWLREQLKHHADNNPDIRPMGQFKTGISSYIRHVATRFASKLSVLARSTSTQMNPVAKLVMSSPEYEEEYAVEEVVNNEDSDGAYVAKDKRSKSEGLKDCQTPDCS